MLNQSEPRDSYFRFAGVRYWTSSLLPAVVGTTLPFWLRPPGFAFKWPSAAEFLAAVVLFHSGFSFFLSFFEKKRTNAHPGTRLLILAGLCLMASCLLGWHLNSGLALHNGVHTHIFIIYGLAAIFVGLLYVMPPVCFYRRPGGEIIIAEGLALIPLLGAYLVQAGDITRRVYLVSIPIMAATAVWILTDELVTRPMDEKSGRKTMVIDFGPKFIGRYAVPALVLFLYVTLVLAVISKSLSAAALALILFSGLGWKISMVSMKDYLDPKKMIRARKYAVLLHLFTGIILALSSCFYF